MRKPDYTLFDKNTQALIYGYQIRTIQRMLDFDHACQRTKPSIAAIINPNREGYHKAFFRKKELTIPMYRTIKDAARKHPKVDVLINFASHRSAYPTSMDAIQSTSIRTIVIIAEGVPERMTRKLIFEAKKRGKTIIGPATVGGLSAGAFRIGNTGGALSNIIASKLYRPGSVGFVSKSGGLSNEMFNVIAKNTDGLYEGIAIGGDMYPGSTLLEHVLRYEANPEIKMIVVLGELGGESEYPIVEALKRGRIKKPLVAWVTGTCARIFPTEVQFGHAGALAKSKRETAEAKNTALRRAGAVVPKSFDELGDMIKKVYLKLRKEGKILDRKEPSVPRISMDYQDAVALDLIRKPTSFICTISDDRGEEPSYAGVPISQVFKRQYTLGDVISLLWFKKKLPKFASDFIEMVLIIVADHGPCVSGAHNAIVASCAGKDLVSSLASGILTIGPRFGGAIDDAARYFKQAHGSGMKPAEFVKDMKAKGINIPGIGHRVKSLYNPDKRVELLKDYARKHFPITDLLDYTLEVESISTAKKNNLILNVDGTIGVLFVDLMRGCGFKESEVQEIIDFGFLNGFFVLGRSIGIIGHIQDQKRLKSRLYRHSQDDVFYDIPRDVGLNPVKLVPKRRTRSKRRR